MVIQLVTFGGLHAVDDTGELQRLLGQHSRAALFVYLVIERRVSRESLLTVFWPESDAENARHALRQSLYQLRKAVGIEWIESRAHDLEVSDEVQSDALAFTHALERGDIESAVNLYQGPFLDGVHLVDLKPWENWVDSRRAQYARAFRKACRDLIDAKRAAGDLTGAIHAAERWTARDPSDSEAQHRLIEALAAAGERAEAIRQYETYARALESDGLEPLGETAELVQRLRSSLGTLPPLRAALSEDPPRTPNAAPTAASPVPVTPHPRRKLQLGAVGLLAAIAVMWSVRARQERLEQDSSPASVAVLPFSVRGSDAVQYLGEGIVNLLGSALDGAGTVRAVDSRATFAAVAEVGDAASNPHHGELVAARLGAAKYVLGDVTEAGGRLQIEAAVYDAETSAATSKAVVSGPADSVFGLVDRLAAQLLGGLGDPAADRLSQTAALTTSSLPAFKAYLLGEGHMRAGQFERAADEYTTALALDSTFAVAHYRLALAREWAPLPGEEEAARDAARHGARLSARDRMLLEAFRQWRTGDATQADRAYRAILARYPDDVDAWFQLGEIQFHYGPLIGRPLSESEEAWRKVLAYEPQNLFALTHLARIAAISGQPAPLDSLLGKFGAEARKDRRLLELFILQAAARGDSGAARNLARDVRQGEPFSVWRIAVFLTAFSPDHVITEAVLQDLTKAYPEPGLRADLLWFRSVLQLAQGKVGAATRTLAEAAESERSVPDKQRRSGFAPVTEWFAVTLPLPYSDSTLRRARHEAEKLVPATDPAFVNELKIGAPIQVEPLRQYTLGTLSLRLGDTASATGAAAKLTELAALGTATSLTRDLDRGLRAQLAWKHGRPEEALRLLEALDARDSQGDVNVIPFVARANERFLHGEVLASLGRHAEALQWFASLGSGSISEVPLQALSHLRQAEIHERLGNSNDAVRHYATVAQLWRDGDPEFREAVAAAHQRMAKLGGPR